MTSAEPRMNFCNKDEGDCVVYDPRVTTVLNRLICLFQFVPCLSRQQHSTTQPPRPRSKEGQMMKQDNRIHLTVVMLRWIHTISRHWDVSCSKKRAVGLCFNLCRTSKITNSEASPSYRPLPNPSTEGIELGWHFCLSYPSMSSGICLK